MRSQFNQFIKVCLIKYFITDAFRRWRRFFCTSIRKYRIVLVEMGKVKLELFGRIVELKLLPEDAQWAN